MPITEIYIWDAFGVFHVTDKYGWARIPFFSREARQKFIDGIKPKPIIHNGVPDPDKILKGVQKKSKKKGVVAVVAEKEEWKEEELEEVPELVDEDEKPDENEYEEVDDV